MTRTEAVKVVDSSGVQWGYVPKTILPCRDRLLSSSEDVKATVLVCDYKGVWKKTAPWRQMLTTIYDS